MVECHYRNCTLSSDFKKLYSENSGLLRIKIFMHSKFFHRKGEKRDLCCAWECSDTDGGISGKQSNPFIFSQGIYVSNGLHCNESS